jgi:hypothetical protein
MGTVPAVDAPARRRRPGSGSVALLAALAVIVAVGLISAMTAGQRSAQPVPASLGGTGVPAVPAPDPVVVHTVTYQLLGGPDALNVTYVAQGADIAQVAEAGTPWSVVIEHRSTAQSSQYYSVSAQNAGPGTLKCRILVDGATVSEGSVADPHGVVRCSKSLPE